MVAATSRESEGLVGSNVDNMSRLVQVGSVLFVNEEESAASFRSRYRLPSPIFPLFTQTVALCSFTSLKMYNSLLLHNVVLFMK